jgi:hypothetical protein
MYSYCYVYVFLLLCIFCSVYSVFIVPADTLRLPWLRFFLSFSSVVRQMSGYNSQRRGTTLILPKLIVLYCLRLIQVCTVLLLPGVNPIAVNMYVYIYLYNMLYTPIFHLHRTSAPTRQLFILPHNVSSNILVCINCEYFNSTSDYCFGRDKTFLLRITL